MSFTNEDIKKVAHLARIAMPEEELNKITPQLDGIMDWIDTLQEINVDGVEPLISVCDYPMPQREDVVKMNNNREDVIKNAPDPDENNQFYTVPKVVE